MSGTVRNKTGIKIGIWSVALLMMGVVGVASALSVIGAHFPEASQTMIQNMVTIPCIVVIFTTILVGKIMESVSKKRITLVGVACFLIGGLGPMFLGSLSVILLFRGVLGIGIGVTQVTVTALVAENFEGQERAQVQGVVQACQMGGMCVMSIFGGILANISWNRCFLVYTLGILSLICLIILVPDQKPQKVTDTGETHKTRLTKASWGWTILMFLNFISIMVYSAFLSYLMTEKGLGTSTDSGISLALFAVAGIIVGVIYGKFADVVKNKMIALSMLLAGVSYLLLAFSISVVTIHIGSFLVGWSLSMFMPPVFLNTAVSVDAWSAPMAISMVTSAQNLGQFVCPYLINPMAAAVSDGRNINQMAFILGAVLSFILCVVMFVWGTRKDRKTAAASVA